MSPNFVVVNKAKNVVDIYIYNDVDAAFGFGPAQLRDSLRDAPAGAALNVHINSNGGSVFDGIAIYNLLRGWSGEVTTIVDGIAASIASIIFLAGAKRVMNDNAMLMIHNPTTMAAGDSSTMAEAVELLKKVETTVRDIYVTRSKSSAEQVSAWMSGETYLFAEEALAAGLATAVVATPPIAASFDPQRLVAKLTTKGATEMFETWLADYCKPLGIAPDKLTAEQRTTLQAKFEISQKAPPVPPPLPSQVKTADDSQQRQSSALEMERQDAIRDVAGRYSDVVMDGDYLGVLGVKAKTVRGLASHAVREGWTVDRFELECRRAERQSIGGQVAVHIAPTMADLAPEAISCALVKAARVPAAATNDKNGQKYGYETYYDDKTLEASDHPKLKDLGLLQLLEMSYIAANGSRYPGRLNTDGFVSSCRDAMFRLRMSANTTWTGLNIFNDAANKMLWASYDAVPTTWQNWVKVMPVNDFKTHNTYRLTMTGGYREVGSDGELKHGGFTDAKYTHSAETYGQLVGLSRKDIINDDLGALSNMMAALGAGGAQFLEELFYVHLMNRLTTLFPTDDSLSNYISGATTDLGVDGLTLAEQKAMNQVDGNNRPILVPANVLLVGTQDSVIAAELFNQTLLQVLQTANVKGRPDQNPHVGKYRPIVSGYLNNAAIKRVSIGTPGAAVPNQTANQWLLLRSPSPSGGIVIGSFLNGNQRPTIEQGDGSFEVLGLQWRAYHDAGADDGDPKWGVFSKGAA